MADLSCPQVLVLYDRLDVIDREGVVRFVAGLQQPDGSFTGDKWGWFRACSICLSELSLSLTDSPLLIVSLR